MDEAEVVSVKYYLRDLEEKMVESWKEAFRDFTDSVEISVGDVFRGAPAVDAIVSPANSFGFMDGGIDLAYSMHFGWQLQNRLQSLLREKYDGELPVGQAVVMETFDEGEPDEGVSWTHDLDINQGQVIKFLISAPTMRVPCDVSCTVNAYLAFRAVIRAVQKHNRMKENVKIRTVICPGLCTFVGAMPPQRSAEQMKIAYETCVCKNCEPIREPSSLIQCAIHQTLMTQYE